MPELPDVAVYQDRLARHALNREIRAVEVPEPDLLAGTSPQGLGRALHGHAFADHQRRGKYLFVAVDDTRRWLVLHFGMTGELRCLDGPSREPQGTGALFRFSDGGALAYTTRRKLGQVGLIDDVEGFIGAHALGPDALALKREQFHALAGGRRGGVKCWLMNQRLISGIGNVYSDEILFQARIHPQSAVARLDDETLDRLFDALRRTLDAAIEAEVDPGRMPAHFLLPQRHADGKCPRCGGALTTKGLCGRTAYLCAACQARRDLSDSRGAGSTNS